MILRSFEQISAGRKLGREGESTVSVNESRQERKVSGWNFYFGQRENVEVSVTNREKGTAG